jgi:hypothetical protein
MEIRRVSNEFHTAAVIQSLFGHEALFPLKDLTWTCFIPVTSRVKRDAADDSYLLVCAGTVKVIAYAVETFVIESGIIGLSKTACVALNIASASSPTVQITRLCSREIALNTLREVALARISGYQYPSVAIETASIRQYFSAPRILKTGSLICITSSLLHGQPAELCSHATADTFSCWYKITSFNGMDAVSASPDSSGELRSGAEFVPPYRIDITSPDTTRIVLKGAARSSIPCAIQSKILSYCDLLLRRKCTTLSDGGKISQVNQSTLLVKSDAIYNKLNKIIADNGKCFDSIVLH